MTRPSAPLPPVMAIIPADGNWKLLSAPSYGFEVNCLRTYRPSCVSLTVLCPKVADRKTSEANLGNKGLHSSCFQNGAARVYSVSMNCNDTEGNSCRAVFA